MNPDPCCHASSADEELPDVPARMLRDVLHFVNNVAARVMLRCETALEEDDADECAAALRSAAEAAEELGRYVRGVRADVKDRRRATRDGRV